MTIIAATRRCLMAAGLAFAAFGAVQAPAQDQSIQQVDPNDYAAIDGDLNLPPETPSYADRALDLPPEPDPTASTAPASADPAVTGSGTSAATEPATAAAASDTYHEDDLIGAAEGRVRQGRTRRRQDDRGPAQEAGRTQRLYRRPRGRRRRLVSACATVRARCTTRSRASARSTGPAPRSVSTLGANAANTFVLVYNLYDTEDLYKRYPAGEGDAYLVGGLTASYLRKGNIVLIPIRLGAGLRLGVNAGYMKFSKKQRWLPF